MKPLHYIALAALAFSLLLAPVLAPWSGPPAGAAIADTGVAIDTAFDEILSAELAVPFADAGTTAADAVVEAVADAPNVIDLGPLIDLGIEFVVILLAPFLLYVAVRWLKLRLSENSQQTLLTALDKAVAFGVAKAREQFGDVGKIEVRNAIIAEAANYAASTVPDALRKYKIGPQGLRDRLLARTEEYLRFEPTASDTIAGDSVAG